MRKVVLYIGMSLDGFIAGPDGGVDWMSRQEENADAQDAYSAFIKTVDTVIMGGNTYRQVATELSPGVWPYREMTTYVVTRRGSSSTGEIRFTAESPCALVRRLRQDEGKSIWICGGARRQRDRRSLLFSAVAFCGSMQFVAIAFLTGYFLLSRRC